jgi:hypothetical protein
MALTAVDKADAPRRSPLPLVALAAGLVLVGWRLRSRQARHKKSDTGDSDGA